MDKISIDQLNSVNEYAEIINLDINNLIEANNNGEIKKIIINFPFKKLYYKANDLNVIFINKHNLTINNIIDGLIQNIIKYEGNNFTFIEGEKVKLNGCYNLSCIYFDKLKYNYDKLFYYKSNINEDIFYINLNLFY